MKLYRWIFRSAKTGNFVTSAFVEKHPDTTTKERVWFWQKSFRVVS